jgi:hypothetical protein
MNFLPSIVGPVSDGARLGDARAARSLGPVIDLEPLHGYVQSDRAAQAARAYGGSSGRQQSFTPRDQRPQVIERRPPVNLGFAAQQIAQEVLSQGLHIENYRPALAAYAAADTNFATVRRPPPSNHVVWA